MGLTLRLVRHGRTAANDERRYCGHADIGLSVTGRAETGALELPPADYSSVVSSDLRRCRETAALLGLEPRFDPALREFDFGEMEGLTWEMLDPDTQAALGDYERFVAPGGEAVTDFAARVDEFVAALGDGVHLLITHGGVIQHLLWRRGDTRRVAPGEWVDLEFSRR